MNLLDQNASHEVPNFVPSEQEAAPPKMPEQEQHAPPTPEQYTNPEQKIPTQEEDGFFDETIDKLKQKLKKKPKQPPQMPQLRDDMTVKVEKILEQGMEDAFSAMTPIQQQQFKMKGEETAKQLRAHIQKAKVKIKDIFRLIFDWLKMIPGVNKFYLEQEAKIKAEKILALRHFDSKK